MNHAIQGSTKLEWLLAGTLHYGTSLASAVISLGLGLALIDSRSNAPSLAILRDMRIVTIGIAMLILLPVVRVIVMLIVYFRHRDYRLAAIALLVLTIILLGFARGTGRKHASRCTHISDAGARKNGSTSRDASHIAGVKFFPNFRAAYVRPSCAK